MKKTFKYIDEFFIRHFTHKIADKMIVISSLMENSYNSNKKLLKLPPLVDVKDEIWRQPIKKNEDSFTFCFSGFPGGSKDSLDKVVGAFNKLKDNNARLKIVGLTEDDFLSLYPEIKKIDKERIEFLGVQSHKSSIKNILSCDCYVFIRQSDRRNNAGFPTKFAESFTCGVPIITTNVSDINEYITLSEENILLENCETESILKAMETVLNKGKNKEKPVLKTDFYYLEYKEKAKQWLE